MINIVETEKICVKIKAFFLMSVAFYAHSNVRMVAIDGIEHVYDEEAPKISNRNYRLDSTFLQ
jgi:hypothetical protein